MVFGEEFFLLSQESSENKFEPKELKNRLKQTF
jgi:hypothetical protein